MGVARRLLRRTLGESRRFTLRFWKNRRREQKGDVDETKKRLVEGGKQGALMKKFKKDKSLNAIAKTTRPKANTMSVTPQVKPKLHLPTKKGRAVYS